MNKSKYSIEFRLKQIHRWINEFSYNWNLKDNMTALTGKKTSSRGIQPCNILPTAVSGGVTAMHRPTSKAYIQRHCYRQNKQSIQRHFYRPNKQSLRPTASLLSTEQAKPTASLLSTEQAEPTASLLSAEQAQRHLLAFPSNLYKFFQIIIFIIIIERFW